MSLRIRFLVADMKVWISFKLWSLIDLWSINTKWNFFFLPSLPWQRHILDFSCFLTKFSIFQKFKTANFHISFWTNNTTRILFSFNNITIHVLTFIPCHKKTCTNCIVGNTIIWKRGVFHNKSCEKNTPS